MKVRRRIETILFGILIPLLFLVWFYGQRFRRLPEWSRDGYPWVLWTLLLITVVIAVFYVGRLGGDAWLRRQRPKDTSKPDDNV